MISLPVQFHPAQRAIWRCRKPQAIAASTAERQFSGKGTSCWRVTLSDIAALATMGACCH